MILTAAPVNDQVRARLRAFASTMRTNLSQKCVPADTWQGLPLAEGRLMHLHLQWEPNLNGSIHFYPSRFEALRWHENAHACMFVWTEWTWNVHHVGISTKTVPSVLCQCINIHMHACWNLFHRLLWCNDLTVRSLLGGTHCRMGQKWFQLSGSNAATTFQPVLTLRIVLLWPTQMLHFPTRQQLKTFGSVMCPASVQLSFEWNEWQKQDILQVGAFNATFVTSTWILRNCQHSW